MNFLLLAEMLFLLQGSAPLPAGLCLASSSCLCVEGFSLPVPAGLPGPGRRSCGSHLLLPA